MAAASNGFVLLKSGLAFPVEPWLLVFELQDRGFLLSIDDTTLVVQPAARLTPADCARIRRWKWHLMAILEHEAEHVQ